jgi:hypothetical protein
MARLCLYLHDFPVRRLSVGELYLTRGASKSEYVPLTQHAHPPAPGVAECLSNIQPDPLLGYGPKPEQSRTSCLRAIGDVPVYDIIVTTLDSGWRITPQRGAKARTAVLFLGCSYTFGDGTARRAILSLSRG